MMVVTRTRNPDTLTSKAIVICMWQQGWGEEWKEEEHFEDVMITQACLDSVSRCAFFCILLICRVGCLKRGKNEMLFPVKGRRLNNGKIIVEKTSGGGNIRIFSQEITGEKSVCI